MLNHLCDAAREALANGALSLAQAEALTLGDAEAQTRLLQRHAQGWETSAADLKEHLLEAKCPVSIAIFPRERYSGTTTRDLFGEADSTYFDDVEQFFTLQKAAVAALAEHHAAQADWVEVTEDYRLPGWQYNEAEAGQTGGVVINLSPCGKVEVREGLAKREIDPCAATLAKKIRPAYSAALCRHLAHHKSMAVQSLLLLNRRKAKEVAVALLLGASDTYDAPLRLRAHDSLRALARMETPPASYRAAEGQSEALAGKLGLVGETGEGAEGEVGWRRLLCQRKDATALYEALKTLDDDALDELLVLLPVLCFGQGNCEKLDTADSLFNRVAQDLEADMRDHWQPDAEFLSRRSRAQLLAIAAESGFAPHRDTKKAELVSALARHFARARTADTPNVAQQKARDWLPEALRFPAIDPTAKDSD